MSSDCGTCESEKLMNSFSCLLTVTVVLAAKVCMNVGRGSLNRNINFDYDSFWHVGRDITLNCILMEGAVF